MTIKDIARLSGCGVATVSRVLNNQPNVSQKARDTIMNIVNEVGFELNTNAKNLKQLKSTTVAVVVKGRANELFAQLVEEIQARMAGLEFPLLVSYIDEDDDEIRCAQQLCREKKPCGFIFLGGTSENFKAGFGDISAPAVLVTNTAAHLGFPNLSSVTSDDTAAARCAVSYLLAQGHREIAVIGGDVEKSEISRLRHDGCVQALQAAGREQTCLYETTRFCYQGGYEAMARILDCCGSHVTAVFAMADVLARSHRQGKLQHIHGTGKAGWESFCALMAERGVPLDKEGIHVREYIDDMPRCMAAADLVICRCGAMTMSELPVMKKPAILVPSPYVAENHQFYNAKALADRGAAVCIEEKDLTESRLWDTIQEVVSSPLRLQKMGEAAGQAAVTDAADRIFDVIRRVAGR